jgi:hypothetical protein
VKDIHAPSLGQPKIGRKQDATWSPAAFAEQQCHLFVCKGDIAIILGFRSLISLKVQFHKMAPKQTNLLKQNSLEIC